jgi:hypothetical protein
MLRREVPLAITIAVGWFMIVDFFVPRTKPVGTELQNWAIIMTACAAILGVANVARINLLKVSRRDRDWGYAIVLLAGLGVMVLLGTLLPIARWALGVDTPWRLGSTALAGVTSGSLFDRLYTSTYVPLSSTMFSLLAFYIASAAFRAFRVRTLESTLLAATALVVMLGNVPVGDAMTGGFLPQVTNWINSVLQVAGQRAILIGAALGAISTGLKVILGIERNFLGTD